MSKPTLTDIRWEEDHAFAPWVLIGETKTKMWYLVALRPQQDGMILADMWHWTSLDGIGNWVTGQRFATMEEAKAVTQALVLMGLEQ